MHRVNEGLDPYIHGREGCQSLPYLMQRRSSICFQMVQCFRGRQEKPVEFCFAYIAYPCCRRVWWGWRSTLRQDPFMRIASVSEEENKDGALYQNLFPVLHAWLRQLTAASKASSLYESERARVLRWGEGVERKSPNPEQTK